MFDVSKMAFGMYYKGVTCMLLLPLAPSVERGVLYMAIAICSLQNNCCFDHHEILHE